MNRARARAFFRPGRLLSTSIFGNFTLSVLNLVLTKGLRLVAITLCVRQLGAASWGEVATTLAFLSLIGLVVSQGLNGLPQVYHVQDRTLDRALWRTITGYRFALAAFVILALHLLALRLDAITPLVLLYSFVLIPRALGVDWVFHRRERYHLTLLIGSLRAVVFFGLVLALVGPESTARAVIAAELVAEAVGLAAGYLLLPRAGFAGSTRGGVVRLGALLAAALPLFLSEALNILSVTLDILFLRLMHGYEAVAEYDIGAKIGLAYFFVGASLVQIVLPKMGRLYAEGAEGSEGTEGGRDALLRVLAVSSNLLLALGALLLLPSFYFAPQIVRFLFDNDAPVTVTVFRWVPVWVYVSFMTMLNTSVLLATGRRRLYFYGTLLATVVNVAGFWLLIRGYAGPGAVAGRFLGEIAFFVFALGAMPGALRAAYKGEVMLQLGLLASLLAVYAATRGFPPVVGALLSLALCGVVFHRRRVFSRETLATLRSH